MKNLRHQIKSQWYYIFWGICTVTVLAGQVYVGSGYRHMAETVETVADYIIKSNE
tara:strand:+ start:666 stop:830 length:165 start_codon:yes stop_codon:yes gene_type:complete